ncbi:flavin reductase [Agrobacterium sp. Ap1]|uniref:flavin reductase family protein n=1 Tax=Rhizobium/Agrobacterium group TaxID=227290 RepID=UPI001573A983|nr:MULTISPECIES: flavin reductase family protein [Rhizobium/Agrobacterium group]MBO0145205.1 flavin reductase [Agrobacterium sp. Ap1]NTF98452.1 flavin reductase [Rhizobium rhizogenes]
MNQATRVQNPHVHSEFRATPDSLKSVMRQVAGTVSVITAGVGDARTGATVTSATALSVDPPTMIVNINRSSSTWPVLASHNHFCINVLGVEDQAVAHRFSGADGLKGVQRYEGAQWTTLSSGASALIGALASIDCEVEEVFERHSHAIIIGRVLAIQLRGGAPLLYSQGRYQSLKP